MGGFSERSSEGIAELIGVGQATQKLILCVPQQNATVSISRWCVGWAITLAPSTKRSSPNRTLGSISGGGRYDDLIGIFRRESLPTTGLSIGVERILDLMKELDLFPPHLATSSVDVLVSVYDEERRSAAVAFAQELRECGLRVDLSYEAGRLRQQFRLADRKGIPHVAVLAPDELAQDLVRSKRLADGDEQVWPRATAVADLRAYIRGDLSRNPE